jgi:hypothetical protein
MGSCLAGCACHEGDFRSVSCGKSSVIHYIRGLEVHSSLLNIVLLDSAHEGEGSNKARAAKLA